MSKAQARLRGTTLVESLVAVVFIGISVSSIVACVTTSNKRDVYARRCILNSSARSGSRLDREEQVASQDGCPHNRHDGSKRQHTWLHRFRGSHQNDQSRRRLHEPDKVNVSITWA